MDQQGFLAVDGFYLGGRDAWLQVEDGVGVEFEGVHYSVDFGVLDTRSESVARKRIERGRESVCLCVRMRDRRGLTLSYSFASASSASRASVSLAMVGGYAVAYRWRRVKRLPFSFRSCEVCVVQGTVATKTVWVSINIGRAIVGVLRGTEEESACVRDSRSVHASW